MFPSEMVSDLNDYVFVISTFEMIKIMNGSETVGDS
jgi:hypothetical protein